MHSCQFGVADYRVDDGRLTGTYGFLSTVANLNAIAKLTKFGSLILFAREFVSTGDLRSRLQRLEHTFKCDSWLGCSQHG